MEEKNSKDGRVLHIDVGDRAEGAADECCAAAADECCVELHSFDDMGLRPELLRGIFAYGFERPSAIQRRAILPIVQGRDTIAQAQSGTGKTGAFAVAALQRVDAALPACQALLLANTRELAAQTLSVVEAIGRFIPALSFQLAVGGGRVEAGPRSGGGGGRAHVVVGTPGRVLDLARRRLLRLHELRLLVLDEADEMLSGTLAEQVRDVVRLLPRAARIALFSATLPPGVLELSSLFMSAPSRILVPPERLTVELIRQFYVAVGEDRFKLDTLCDLYESLDIAQAVIFVNGRARVEWLTASMRDRDFAVSAVHGSMAQEERSAVMRDFRTGVTRVLIATDLIARGIDVQQVSLVINYDLPLDRENYLHRIGRSGRYLRRGVAINLLTGTRRDIDMMRDIESHYGTRVVEMPSDLKL
jgi:translation initiation factor 4A